MGLLVFKDIDSFTQPTTFIYQLCHPLEQAQGFNPDPLVCQPIEKSMTQPLGPDLCLTLKLLELSYTIGCHFGAKRNGVCNNTGMFSALVKEPSFTNNST